ncbi:hypothetical protein, partial [Hymenobacter coccineus]|uniref:hypothetical protein n=1 Tax=Hymenobacter coccineus TaxID=1908235 RepID=UPI00195587D5
MGERFVLKQGLAHATAHLRPGGALLVLASSTRGQEAASLSAGGRPPGKMLASGVLEAAGRSS